LKKRVLSAIVIFIVFATTLLIDSKVFALTMFICGLVSLNELISIKYKNKKIDFIKFVCFVTTSLIILNGIFFKLDTLFILLLPILLLLSPIVFYNDNKRYNIDDALYLLGILFFIGFSFNIIVYLREVNINMCIFIFIIAFITDTYAFISGKLIGKHKLTTISPKKTIEGSVFGSLVGTFIGSVYYYITIGNISLISTIILCLMLTILSEIGDLVFSSIKRYFNIKDYSNLIPGHGGMLDRFDSIIFVALGLAFWLTIF